jgi:acetyltransferase-like isoleucine patch superfamily enzyme
MLKALIEKYRRKLQHPTVQCSKMASINNVQFGIKNIVAQNAFLNNVTLGNYSSIGRNTTVNNATLGKFCSVSWNCTIGATSHPYTHLSSHAFPYHSFFEFTHKTEKIKVATQIGHDVWIGANAIIMPGITVGDGAVIGAGSIVTKDVPAYAIVTGAPAKIKKYRFTDEELQRVKALEWWNWSKETIKANVELFKQPITSESLKQLEQINPA